jgi:hypothetical protein
VTGHRRISSSGERLFGASQNFGQRIGPPLELQSFTQKLLLGVLFGTLGDALRALALAIHVFIKILYSLYAVMSRLGCCATCRKFREKAL